MSRKEAIPGHYYRHIKSGRKYFFHFEALHEATKEPMAVYSTEGGQVWVRPMAEFKEKFTDEQGSR